MKRCKNYRIVIGEIGNEQGHIVGCNATNEPQAILALKRRLKVYKGHGWGRVEYNPTPNQGEYWMRLTHQ